MKYFPEKKECNMQQPDAKMNTQSHNFDENCKT